MQFTKLSTDISEFEKSLNAPICRIIGGFGSLPYNRISEALAKIKEEDKLGNFLTEMKRYESLNNSSAKLLGKF